MVLGMSLQAFTFVHVLVSLVGIGSGFIVVFGLLRGKRMDGSTALLYRQHSPDERHGNFCFPLSTSCPLTSWEFSP